MTLSYTQVEEFNQIKIILLCDYLYYSLIIVQTRYSLFKTNQQAHTCSLFQHEMCYPKIESNNHIQYNNDKWRIKSSHQHHTIGKKTKENNQNNKTRVQVTLDVEKKPQALSTPSNCSEYTIKNFPGYKTQQWEAWLSPSSTVLNHLLLHTYHSRETNLTMVLGPAWLIHSSTH